MKNLVAMMLVVFVLAGFVTAADKDWSYNFETGYVSKYVCSSGTNLYDNPAWQSSFTMAHESGWYGNFWQSGEAGRQFFDNENPWVTEMDWTVGYTFKLFGLDTDAGASWYDCGKLGNRKDDSIYSYLRLSKTYEIDKNQSWSPYVKFNVYNMVQNVPGDGFIVHIGACHNLKLTDNLNLSSDFAAVIDDGAYGNDRGVVGKAVTCFNWQLTKDIVFKAPSVTLYSPLQSLSDERKTEVVIGASIAFNF